MNRLFCFALALGLALSGCHRPTGAAASEKPNPPAAKAGSPAAPGMPVAFTPETGSLISPEEVPLLEQINRENTRVAASALPSIVRVTAVQPVDPQMQLFGKDLPFQFHFGPGGPHPAPDNEPSFGSGVIISKDGYIVTNSHVVEDSRDIAVELQDKSTFPARLVASDSQVDVAVLKIDAAGLRALPWGDSDKVQVGEQVFAIGNPFNLDDSVSKGIISAKGRNLENSNNYEDYLQTDAAINPGNSGGALVNIHGELIGINAAIASTSRMNMGVGFAIPSNLVRYAVDGLLKEGRLVRGYLGVRLPETVDDGVMHQLKLQKDHGALLAGVQPGSPADVAQLHSGDFITEVDNHKIHGVADLRLVVAEVPIGKEVTVRYIRDGTAQSTTVKIGELPQIHSANSGSENDKRDPLSPNPAGAQPVVENVLSGLQVTDLNDKVRQKLGVDNLVTTGVVVTDVKEGSSADAKGLMRGDVIESACVNRGSTQQVAAGKDFTDLAKKLQPDQSVVLLVHHGKESSFIYLAPPK